MACCSQINAYEICLTKFLCNAAATKYAIENTVVNLNIPENIAYTKGMKINKRTKIQGGSHWLRFCIFREKNKKCCKINLKNIT